MQFVWSHEKLRYFMFSKLIVAELWNETIQICEFLEVYIEGSGIPLELENFVSNYAAGVVQAACRPLLN